MCKIYSISIISFDEDFFPSCMPSGSRFQFCFISVLFVTFLFLSLYTWFNTYHHCLSVLNSVCADNFTGFHSPLPLFMFWTDRWCMSGPDLELVRWWLFSIIVAFLWYVVNFYIDLYVFCFVKKILCKTEKQKRYRMNLVLHELLKSSLLML